jgi:hypothetical protein
MDSIPRRGSTGRGNILENSIKIFNDLIQSKCDVEEISTYIINNTLPNEVRSIAWRIFLNILPREKTPFEWIEITRKNREVFDKFQTDPEIENLTKIIRKEDKDAKITDESVAQDFKEANLELNKLANNYDFFKSEIVAETLLRIFLIWKRQNPDIKDNLNAFYVLAGIIFSLYPSILHISNEIKEITSEKDADAKSVFYFLNSEEYFDNDVYSIYDTLMNVKGLKEILNSSNDASSSLSAEELKKLREEEDLNLSKEYVDKLNRYDRISNVYFAIVNKELYNHLNDIKVDSYSVIQKYFKSLLSSNIKLEHLVYFWDNLFLHSPGNDLEFMGYINLALITYFNDQLRTASNSADVSLLLEKYPDLGFDPKNIIKKAMKIRDKVHDALS